MEKLIESLKDHGIKAWEENGALKFAGEKKNITNEVLKILHDNKEQLLAYVPRGLKHTKTIATRNQMALWIEQKLGNKSGYIHNGAIKRLHQVIDLNQVKEAFLRVMQTYEILTSTFDEEDGIVYIMPQEIDERFFHYFEIMKDAKDVQRVIEETMLESLDLKEGPLFQVAVFKCGESDYYISFWAHHIISDAYSLFVIEKEFYRYYDEVKHGIPYIRKQRSHIFQIIKEEKLYLSEKRYQEDLSYWKSTIDASIPGTTLPKFRLAQSEKLYFARTFVQKMTQEISDKITQVAKKHSVTPYILMFALFNLGIHRMNESKENSIGLFAANRMEEESLGEVGYFSNAIVYQDCIEKQETLLHYILRVKKKIIQSLSYQHMPFTSLVEEMAPTRENGMPFFNIAFDSLLFPKDEEKNQLQKNLGFEDIALQKGSGTYDLIVWLYEQNEHYELEYRFNGALFDEYQIESLSTTIDEIVKWLDYEDIEISEIPALSGRFKDIVDKSNATSKEIVDSNVYELFAEQVNSIPNKLAIQYENCKLSYAKSQQIAQIVAKMIEAKQKKQDTYVGVRLNKGPYLIPVILGIWAAGAVYVPIDPKFPANRVDYIIQHTELSIMIEDDFECERMSGMDHISLGEIIEEVNKENIREDVRITKSCGLDRPAYVLYTSGSTGNPKGVVISHRGLSNFLIDMRQKTKLESLDSVLAITSISFDISMLEMFLPLISGANVVLISHEDSKSGKRILETIQTYGITYMQATPSTYEILYEYYKESKIDSYVLKTCLCGGESYELDLVRKIQVMSHKVYNVYGPTETTIWSTIYEIPQSCEKLKIGQPIANTTIRITDKDGKECPVLVPGELNIGGVGVFQGYYHSPELTKEVLVSTPKGEKFYRTGDWAYWNQEGELIFLGRRDSQIKIRGFRVEISEIENVFRKCDDVRQVAVVTIKQDGVYILVAAIVKSEHSKSSKEEINAYISEFLPEYMRPSNLIYFDELPKTSNNKIDKKTIREIVKEKLFHANEEQQEARTEQEMRVRDLWNEILKSEVTSIDKGFFEVGGDSLLLNRLAIRLEKEFHREINIVELLTYNTIRKMTSYLSDEKLETRIDDDKMKEVANRRSHFIKKRKM